MGSEIGTQVVTVAGTLGGVVLTLTANAYLERRRSRETRDLESLRLAAERTRWLRDERVRAYAGLSIAGEEVLQFIRSELLLIGLADAVRRDEAEVRWRELRTELRKAYNQVALFGTEPAQAAGQHMWRTARNGGNDLLRAFAAGPDAAAANEPELTERIRAVVSDLGIAGERFLHICRQDLQG